MKLRSLFPLLAVTVVFFSCGDDSTGPANQSPRLSAMADMSLAVGQRMEATVQATDMDGDEMTFAIESNPGFATIAKIGQTGNVAEARLTLQPGTSHLGSHTVTIRVSDPSGGSDTHDCGVRVEGADVTLTLALPGDAEGRPFGVFLDTDIDPDNGYAAAAMGTADAGAELTYSLGAVAPGSYFAFAAVCVASDCSSGPEDGDWFGVHGTPLTLNLSPASGYVGDPVMGSLNLVPNATVPSSGTTGFDVTLHEYLSGELELSVGGVSATEFIVSWNDNTFALDFFMPNAGAAGSHRVLAAFEGCVFSDAVAWNQMLTGDPTDPANDDPQTATAIEIPVDGVGSFLNGDEVDWYTFTLQSQTSIAGVLDWNNEKDLDAGVFDETGELECEAATYEKPEEFFCTLSAGTHYLAVLDYDAWVNDDFALVSYRGTAWVSQGAQWLTGRPPAIEPGKVTMLGRLHR